MQYGSVFSKEYIDANPIPVVSPGLLPWLKKDLETAHVGCMVSDKKTGEPVHDRSGLDFAVNELKGLEAKARETKNAELAAIYSIQVGWAQKKVEFWRGKIYLLEKIIAAKKNYYAAIIAASLLVLLILIMARSESW